ncbi:hypothetical protein K493DRAFT_305957 [Basidiobolus meristosporus CBS 931.73]|uniref:Uncharacterized protein n=1 Tax=Basidiobolus meristosporus CBS 931.73 TaxID=1314790 RepID=A0A1Y1XTW0_9FUNG|nr:hypothetical protein K493DRAFT_305957 [Basidiobolus meristosporus CBS 931.73]|eukprot:ORX89207.1 hypothetical protein K493DRAFT_305957 [Basidiobolus meristosporus CBS 931.73]
MTLVVPTNGLTPAQQSYRFPMDIPTVETDSLGFDPFAFEHSPSQRYRKSSWASNSSELSFLPSPPKSRKSSACSALSDHSAIYCRTRKHSNFSTLSHIDEEAIFIGVQHSQDFRTCPQLIFSQPKLLGGSRFQSANWNSSAHDDEVLTSMVLDINPRTHNVSEVFQLSDKRLLIVIENFLTNCTEIYHDTIRNIPLSVINNTPKLTLNRHYDLCAIDESKRVIALYNLLNGELMIVSYKFAKENSYSKQILHMFPHFDHHSFKARKLLFVLGTCDLLFIESAHSYRTFDMLTATLRK